MFSWLSKTPAPWYQRLKTALSRTRQSFQGIVSLFRRHKTLTKECLKEIEKHLLMADVGLPTTQALLATLKTQSPPDPEAAYELLKNSLVQILAPSEKPLLLSSSTKPFVLLAVGVNGSGKTTTLGKLAHLFQQEGLSVMLAAGDTFRAAAIEQLHIWGERNQIPVISQQPGADSAAVLYDALHSAHSKKIDVLLADTAGRLHTHQNLMEELKKIKRVLQKRNPEAPHETLLVLDATTGQNALKQVQQFHEALEITGIVLTKLDGTAKGGIVFAIAHQLQLPIRYIGVGEGLDDLRSFQAQPFVEALLATPSEEEPE